MSSFLGREHRIATKWEVLFFEIMDRFDLGMIVFRMLILKFICEFEMKKVFCGY